MLLTDDLLHNYKRCHRRGFLELYGNRRDQDREKDFVKKLHQESQKHLAKVLSNFDCTNLWGSKIDSHSQQISQNQYKTIAQTQKLMAEGVEVINQGILACDNLEKFIPKDKKIESILKDFPEGINFIGYPTLLIKKEGKSKFGDWLYYPINVKFGSRPKGEYKLIAVFHALILGEIQGCLPPHATLILRDGKEYNVTLESWLDPLEEIIINFIEMTAQKQEPEVFISRQRCSLCPWYSHCYNIAQNQKHLSLIPGITPKRYEQLQQLKITTVESLADSCPKTLGEYIGGKVAFQLQQQAESLVKNKPFFKGLVNNFHLPSNNFEIYFDIEAEPDLNLDYLLGILLVNRLNNSHKFYGFLAENMEEEVFIWKEFIYFLQQYPTAPIFHFSEYETDTINRLSSLYHTNNKDRLNILSRCVDLHRIVINHITAPVENYSLKSLGNWLGFQWHDQGIGGDQCVWWYDQWLKTGDRQYLDLIVRYNQDDCWATYHLKNWLTEFFDNHK
jgi:predicted RecB family nuclease